MAKKRISRGSKQSINERIVRDLIQALNINVAIVPVKRAPKQSSKPHEGSQKFFVLCDRLTIYTSIGADNRHHASNKATKLFGPHWDKITQDASHGRGYQFYPVGAFSELIRTL